MRVAVLVAFCFALVSPNPGGAQTRAAAADLAGQVLDVTGGALPGATVTATSRDTARAWTATTDMSGRYYLAALPSGSYLLRIELSGFGTVERAVDLHLGTLATVDIALGPAREEQVTVTAAATLVDTRRTEVSSIVDRQQIERLPINGRNFLSFAVVTPGVTTDNTPQQGASATSGLTFAGQRGRSNNITVDGLDNNDIVIGSVRATFSQEAVREFQVITNSYSAEFGKAAGGLVNIVTKSGTNVPGGAAFYYFRDDTLNAANYFERFNPAGAAIDRIKAPFGQHQFGGVLGGPVQKNRTFLFGSYERLNIRTNNFVTIDDQTPISVFGRPVGTTADILRRAGFPLETGNVPYSNESQSWLAKLDTRVHEHNLTVRYNGATNYNENIEPWGGLVAKSRGALLDSRDHMLAASDTAILSRRVVNELRFEFARRNQDIRSLDPTCGGPCVGEDQGGPTIEVLGFASAGRQAFTPQPRANDRYQVLDTVSVASSSHLFKAGIDVNYVDHKRQALPLYFGGRYLFTALPAIPGVLPAPVSAVQALALNLPAAYIQGYGTSSVTYGYRDLSVFAQDDWQATPRLTLKAGLRYQRQYWPDLTYRTPGYAGSYLFPPDGDNLAPRVAASWAASADRQTAVHGAYGVYFDNHITALAGITDIINGSPTGMRTYAARFPATLAAWNAPGRRLPESAVGPFPSVVIALDPGLRTPYAHQASIGISRALPHNLAFSADVAFARGHNQVGTIDYNPLVPSLGAGRRPLDVNGVPGTSAPVLQYTSFGETWYQGLTLSLSKRTSNRAELLISYTLSDAEDNSTDFQSDFLPQNNGLGRNSAETAGLPIGFDAMSERGPSTQDQRHRFVASGWVLLPASLQLSAIATLASGRPYNILAGVDLNGDGDGGTIPGPDRARRVLSDPATSVGRNAGTLPMQATVDARLSRRISLGGSVHVDLLFEVFNLFNRSNFTDVNNVFGTGAYPSDPLPTFGQFQQAGAARQVQLAARFTF